MMYKFVHHEGVVCGFIVVGIVTTRRFVSTVV